MSAQLADDDFVVRREAVVPAKLAWRALFGGQDQAGIQVEAVGFFHGTILLTAL
jgi:hypothetical protein